jgi:phosphoribosylamine---glycine ligase
VIASEGYPEKPLLGREISGIEEAGKVEGAVVFHSGTKREGGSYTATGGRVLGVAARGDSLDEATSRAYDAASRIGIAGSHYRRDIGRSKVGEAMAAEKANG